jgi:hypothetical protein
VRIGEPVICAACARTFRLHVELEPLPWSTVETVLADREADLCAFNWHRAGVGELPPNPRLKRIDRLGTIAGVLVLVVLTLIARAVLS